MRTVMITGDNSMCGLYIARQAGMLAPGAEVSDRGGPLLRLIMPAPLVPCTSRPRILDCPVRISLACVDTVEWDSVFASRFCWLRCLLRWSMPTASA